MAVLWPLSPPFPAQPIKKEIMKKNAVLNHHKYRFRCVQTGSNAVRVVQVRTKLAAGQRVSPVESMAAINLWGYVLGIPKSPTSCSCRQLSSSTDMLM